MDREIHVRLECDYHLRIRKDMKLDEVRDLLVDHFLNEGELESVGIEIIDRTDDKLKRLRKGS